MSADEREYLVCVDGSNNSKRITKGKIYITLTRYQRYPKNPSGDRQYYFLRNDSGRMVTLYGYRFKQLQVKKGDR